MRHCIADFQFEVLCSLHTSKKGSQIIQGKVHPNKLSFCEFINEKANTGKKARES